MRKYSAPLNLLTLCHISGFKHKEIKVDFFVKNQHQVWHNNEVEWNSDNIFKLFLRKNKLKSGACNIIRMWKESLGMVQLIYL